MQPLNLLPESCGRIHLIKRRLAQWGTVWLVFSLVVLGLGWHQLRDYRVHGEQLSALDEDAAPLIAMRQDTLDMRKRLKDLKRREELVLNLAEHRSLLSLFGVLSRAARDASGEVSVAHLSIKEDQQRVDPKSGSDTRGLSRVIVDGMGTNDVAVAQFVNALRDSGLFQEVRLESTAPRVINGQAARNYHLTCTY